MGRITRLAEKLLGRAKTADYRQFGDYAFRQPRELPLFTFDVIRQMLFDSAIKIGLAWREAPLHQAEFAYQDGLDAAGKPRWTPGVKADRPEVARYVERQLKRIWHCELHKVLKSQIWGWSAGEVTYKLNQETKQIDIDRFLHRHSRDCFALTKNGEVAAVRIKRVAGHGNVDLKFPKAWWHSFDAEAESPYGDSALRGSYSPWADKWLEGAALDTRRLFMHKDAYGGIDLGYPAGTTNIEGKGEIPNRDIARELVEQIKAGGVTTRPSDVDPSTGKERWPLTRATVPANPVHILQYPKDLDVEIWHGLQIADDIIQSAASGAWQGKQVPMQAFFTMLQIWLNSVIRSLTVQLLEPLVQITFGRPEAFEVSTKPLAEQGMEQMDQASTPAGAAAAPVQQPQQRPASQQLGLEQLIGRGFPADAAVALRDRLRDTPTGLVDLYSTRHGLDDRQSRLLRALCNGDHN